MTLFLPYGRKSVRRTERRLNRVRRSQRHMPTATIRLFLVHGDPKRLRIAELSNWTGKAVSAPRTEFEGVLAREESEKSGIYYHNVIALLERDRVAADEIAYPLRPAPHRRRIGGPRERGRRGHSGR